MRKGIQSRTFRSDILFLCYIPFLLYFPFYFWYSISENHILSCMSKKNFYFSVLQNRFATFVKRKRSKTLSVDTFLIYTVLKFARNLGITSHE